MAKSFKLVCYLTTDDTENVKLDRIKKRVGVSLHQFLSSRRKLLSLEIEVKLIICNISEFSLFSEKLPHRFFFSKVNQVVS